MLVERMDHIVFAVPKLRAAAKPFEKLGLVLTPLSEHPGLGTAIRAFMLGHDPASQFYADLLEVTDPAAAEAAGSRAPYLRALAEGRRAARIVLAVDDMDSARARLGDQADRAYEVFRSDGSKVGDVLPLEGVPGGCDLALIRDVRSASERFAAWQRRGLFDHRLPLKRLDHLAVIAQDLETATRWWHDSLGVPVHGEVGGPGMVIRQLKTGDAILELIGADSPESPVAKRPPGLLPMVACEVENLERSVALVRKRGFTIADPAAGVLPGTRTATVTGDQLAGVMLQLLEYV